jgi:multiple sugar transport system ATP-binding protein
MFVAGFLGSPTMNFLRFSGSAAAGAEAVSLNGAEVEVPVLRDGASGDLVLGVRPEHVRLDGEAPYRGRVLATEYLGTTQIVTVETAHGEIKARLPASEHVREGGTTGLRFDQRAVTIFDTGTGRALLSAANEGVLAHG